MNSYLEIAELILDAERKPLTARQILAKAYATKAVPRHLHGSTQHKTMQARISEDILAKREHSAFFRPRPGAFFLRKFLDDASIPEEHRRPISARRRTRDLFQGPALAVPASCVSKYFSSSESVPAGTIYGQVDASAFTYADPKQLSEDTLLVWAAAVVVRGTDILCYRAGRYRDNRDGFAQKQTLAFSSLVGEGAISLFDEDRLGIRETALRSAVLDLDIPVRTQSSIEQELQCSVRAFLRGSHPAFRNSLVAMVVVECPPWFEPTTKRLSLNELRWVSLKAPRNNMNDFDPWSVLIWHQLAVVT